MKMGAIVANASENCKDNIYDFGRNVGIAFQLQDDYLDAFGDPDTFGKQVGGDIIENKKTFLYLTALEGSSISEKEKLTTLFSQSPEDPTEKIKIVKELFVSTGAARASVNEMEKYTAKANNLLDKIDLAEDKKAAFRGFGEWLMKRKV